MSEEKKWRILPKLKSELWKDLPRAARRYSCDRAMHRCRTKVFLFDMSVNERKFTHRIPVVTCTYGTLYPYIQYYRSFELWNNIPTANKAAISDLARTKASMTSNAKNSQARCRCCCCFTDCWPRRKRKKVLTLSLNKLQQKAWDHPMTIPKRILPPLKDHNRDLHRLLVCALVRESLRRHWFNSLTASRRLAPAIPIFRLELRILRRLTPCH